MPSLPGTPLQRQVRFNPNVTNHSARTCDLTGEDLAAAITLHRGKIRIADGLLVERGCETKSLFLYDDPVGGRKVVQATEMTERRPLWADEDALALAQRPGGAQDCTEGSEGRPEACPVGRAKG